MFLLLFQLYQKNVCNICFRLAPENTQIVMQKLLNSLTSL